MRAPVSRATNDGRRKGGRGTYSHTQQARAVVLAREVLVREVLRPVDARAARAVAVQEIPALDHEVRDLPTPVRRQQHHISPSRRHAHGDGIPPRPFRDGGRRRRAEGGTSHVDVPFRSDVWCSGQGLSGKGNSPRGGSGRLCSPGAALGRSWSRRCRIGGSFPRFWGRRGRRVPS